jgi:hypothetical protein
MLFSCVRISPRNVDRRIMARPFHGVSPRRGTRVRARHREAILVPSRRSARLARLLRKTSVRRRAAVPGAARAPEGRSGERRRIPFRGRTSAVGSPGTAGARLGSDGPRLSRLPSLSMRSVSFSRRIRHARDDGETGRLVGLVFREARRSMGTNRIAPGRACRCVFPAFSDPGGSTRGRRAHRTAFGRLGPLFPAASPSQGAEWGLSLR